MERMTDMNPDDMSTMALLEPAFGAALDDEARPRFGHLVQSRIEVSLERLLQ